MWYFVKCIYFGLSAYQIRCGYPTRVLGNFLTKSYNYVNLFLFQGWVTLGDYHLLQLGKQVQSSGHVGGDNRLLRQEGKETRSDLEITPGVFCFKNCDNCGGQILCSWYLYFTWVLLNSVHFNTNICTFYSLHFQNRIVTLVLMHLRGIVVYFTSLHATFTISQDWFQPHQCASHMPDSAEEMPEEKKKKKPYKTETDKEGDTCSATFPASQLWKTTTFLLHVLHHYWNTAVTKNVS